MVFKPLKCHERSSIWRQRWSGSPQCHATWGVGRPIGDPKLDDWESQDSSPRLTTSRPWKTSTPVFFLCRLRTRISCHCGIFGLIFSGIWEVGDIWKSYPRWESHQVEYNIELIYLPIITIQWYPNGSDLYTGTRRWRWWWLSSWISRIGRTILVCYNMNGKNLDYFKGILVVVGLAIKRLSITKKVDGVGWYFLGKHELNVEMNETATVFCWPHMQGRL